MYLLPSYALSHDKCCDNNKIVVMVVLLVTGCILVITVLVGVVVITKVTKVDQDMVQVKTENYGTNTEQVKDLKTWKTNNDNLEEAMLCSDVEIEKAEAEIMKAFEETLDINEAKDLNKYFSIDDQELDETISEMSDNNPIKEEEAVKAIQCQAKEFDKYAESNKKKNTENPTELKKDPAGKSGFLSKIFSYKK